MTLSVERWLRCGRSVVVGTACALASLGAGGCAADTKPMVVRAAPDVTFVPLDSANPDAAQIAVLWGDPASGASDMLLRFKRGEGAFHTHSSDYHLYVLQGTLKHWIPGEQETDAKPLGPGSFWFQPGNQVHSDACQTDQCITYIHWEGKRDGRLADSTR